ncbi:HAD family hydrolase [Roseobacter weihaiensis]|uniref:HAD family hydrolase n=1 Tax=Roseobacter weihaiensis TaxID=2763262 RepID=UPI001D09A549|nr:HAD family phosphatase [Roseobacter sp. H9]
MSASVVIFDIGGVLVDWQPHLAWAPEMGSEAAAHAFIERTGFRERNARADKGARFADLAAEIENAEDRHHFAQYVARYTRTVQNAVPGTWALLDRLIARGVPIHAITNWSAETWPEGLKVHRRLGDVFGTTIVSGAHGLMKPDPRIFQLLCDSADVRPEDCVFIDDSPRNVEGARAVGMDAIHFTGAEGLARALHQRGLL